MFQCIWIFQISIASLWLSIGVAYRGYMSHITALEELEPKEDDYDYMEELGDDQSTGATSHPTS